VVIDALMARVTSSNPVGRGASWEDDRMHKRMASHRGVSGRSLA